MSTFQDTPRDDNPMGEVFEHCTACKQMKPLSAFYPDPRAIHRHQVRHYCKACSIEKSGVYRAGRRQRQLVGSGVRISAGNGVITQVKVTPERQLAEIVPLPPQVGEHWSLKDWQAMKWAPSVFVVLNVALYMHEGGAVDILTMTGDGPGKPQDEDMTAYILKLLMGVEPGNLQGTVYY